MESIAAILWSSKHRTYRFQEWQRSGLFESMWMAGLVEYDFEKGLEWE
jgi:hypothetical protein